MQRLFRCLHCGKEYPVETRRFRCECGAPFELIHDRHFDKKAIHKEIPSIWRYQHCLPVVDEQYIVSMGEGFTPILPFSVEDLNLHVKLEFISPTGSFKDRGASLLISFLQEMGIHKIVEDSSGNAGSAVAAYSARAGIECEIYCPSYASEGKLTQIRLYGARLKKIQGTREDTSKAVQIAAQKNYYASHNWNPIFLEGLKTIAFEIAEQYEWKMPDNIVIPLGFGGLYYGIYLGFQQLYEDKIINKLPRLFGVQSAHCSPIYDAFTSGKKVDPQYQQMQPTLAEGIAAAKPLIGAQILQAVHHTKGSVTAVTEEEIIEGLRLFHQNGLFIEPTSAVVWKGLKHFIDEGTIQKEEDTLLILTGHGLKAVDKLQEIFPVAQ